VPGPCLSMWHVWVATRTSVENPFGAPTNVGPDPNSTGFQGRSMPTTDGSTLFWMSDQVGGLGSIDIWQVALRTR